MQALQVSVRLSLRNILFATDFSAASDAAVPYALAFAQWYEAKVFVTHIVSPEPRLSVPLDPLPVEADYNWQAAEKRMEAYSRRHDFDNVAHQFLLKQGGLVDVLSRVIRRQEIDLIVLGSHGRHGISKMVLGSTAEQVFRTASCPVLTVGPKATKGLGEPAALKRILFATDFSVGSLNALPYALSLAEENQASVILLHLITLAPIEQERQAALEHAKANLRALVPGDAEAWCKPEFVAQFDFPEDGILRLAELRDVDLIVMGVRRVRSVRLAAHAPWATAYEVVCRAHCPVLTVRN